MNRILFVSRGGIGNCLMVTPAIRYVRETLGPSAYIAAILENTSVPALDRNPDLDVATYDWDWVMQQPWDIVYCPPPLPRGWDDQIGQIQCASVEDRPDEWCDRMHEAEVALDLVGFPKDGRKAPLIRFSLANDERQRAREMMGAQGLRGKIVALAYGCCNMALPGEGKTVKLWPMKHWVRLAQMLEAEGCSIILAGSEREAAWRFKFDEAGVRYWMPQVSLGEIGAILAECDVAVTNDNGLMHLANAVGTQVVAVMGPSAPGTKTRPWNPGGHVIALGIACQPCYRTNVGFGECAHLQMCMKDLSPERVIPTVRYVLKEAQG